MENLKKLTEKQGGKICKIEKYNGKMGGKIWKIKNIMEK